MKQYLYLMCYRFEALVASNLDPDQFAVYMAVGGNRLTRGRVMFFEVDPDQITDPALGIEQAFAACEAKGEIAKRSAYACSYRVWERVPRSALGTLHLATRDGSRLGLAGTTQIDDNASAGPFMYAELSPVFPRVVSSLPPGAFGRRMTDTSYPVSVPRLFYCDQHIDRTEDGRIAPHLPYRDHQHIVACLDSLSANGKDIKIVDRVPPLASLYRTILSGFYVADAEGVSFYRFPSAQELDREHHDWKRAADLD